MSNEREFIGPLTRQQQIALDTFEARKHLLEVIPDKCRDCWPHLKLQVLGSLGTKVALGEITLDQAKLDVVQYTAGCSGTEVDTTKYDADPICPKQEEENQTPQYR